MFNTNAFELNSQTVSVLVVLLIVSALQFLICYKVKKLFHKLIPVILLALFTIVIYVLAACIGGWDGFFLVFYAITSFYFLIACGVGWAIWLIYVIVKKLKNKM